MIDYPNPIRLLSCVGQVILLSSMNMTALNPTTVMVVLMLGLWLLLGCDNNIASISSDRKDYFEVDFREFHRDLRSFKLKVLSLYCRIYWVQMKKDDES